MRTSSESDAKGWLKGLSDPHIGRALALLHQDLQRSWTADDLATEVGLSRSAFNARFSMLTGMPPMRYLQFFRLQTARERLKNGRDRHRENRPRHRLRFRAGVQSRIPS